MAKILLVDDRPANLTALAAVLAPLGQELVAAGSGEEALRCLLQHEFAVILLDVQMPGMDGFETARRIKQREKTRHVPIIFLTALSLEPRQALQGYTVGAVDYLLKPFEPVVLRSKVSVFLDLHRLRLEAEDLAHRALHDSLTQLPNRALLMDHLKLALARLRRDPSLLAVTFIDLDGFKQVNDLRGHDVGDSVLVAVAGRLTSCLRPTDTVARLGGDEFIVLSPGLTSRYDATEIARRICEALGEPIQIAEGEPVELGASMGIAFASGADQDPEGLIREADAAMYVAKEDPRLSWALAGRA